MEVKRLERIIYHMEVDGHLLEYSVVGTGTPILLFHGGHSNCREELGYERLVKSGFSIITPSRPGYGATSKELGETFELASRCYAKMLDQLDIKKVHIIAVSAGGPSGISFASMYPDRTNSLILQSAVTKEWLSKKSLNYKVAKFAFHPLTEKWTWKLVARLSNRNVQFMFKQFVPSFSKLPAEEVMKQMKDSDLEAFQRMNNRYRSGKGFLLDLEHTSKQFHHLLTAIQSPTLILHSLNDQAVSLEHAHHAKKSIPTSTLCLLDNWGHLLWIGKDAGDIHNQVEAFIKKHDLVNGHVTL